MYNDILSVRPYAMFVSVFIYVYTLCVLVAFQQYYKSGVDMLTPWQYYKRCFIGHFSRWTELVLAGCPLIFGLHVSSLNGWKRLIFSV